MRFDTNTNPRLILSLLVTLSMLACGSDPPVERDPVLVGGQGDDADNDADASTDTGAVEGVTCTGEEYPCGPYGNRVCDTITDLRFIPVNNPARDLAGEDGFLDLHDLTADESVGTILLFGTAWWCSACTEESRALNALYADFQNIAGPGGTHSRVEFVAVVFEDDEADPATTEVAERYAERYDFDFPTVADTSGDILYYFDAASSPGNIFIDGSDMRIIYVIQGYSGAVMSELFRDPGVVADSCGD